MSAKNCDTHNRFRDKTIAFRVSSEEDKQINTVVELSGMTKQDYITSKLLDRTIYVWQSTSNAKKLVEYAWKRKKKNSISITTLTKNHWNL